MHTIPFLTLLWILCYLEQLTKPRRLAPRSQLVNDSKLNVDNIGNQLMANLDSDDDIGYRLNNELDLTTIFIRICPFLSVIEHFWLKLSIYIKLSLINIKNRSINIKNNSITIKNRLIFIENGSCLTIFNLNRPFLSYSTKNDVNRSNSDTF